MKRILLSILLVLPNAYAAHGYAPVLLAGAEIIRLVKTNKLELTTVH